MSASGPAHEHTAEDIAEEIVDEISHAVHVMGDSLDELLRLPEPPASRWHRAGVTPRAERWLDRGSALVLVLFASAWAWSIAEARGHEANLIAPARVTATTPATAAIAAALTSRDAPTAAFLTNAAMEALAPLRGRSGKLRAVVRPAGAEIADSLPTGAELAFSRDSAGVAGARGTGATPAAPTGSGIWRMAVRVGAAARQVSDMNVITLTPLSERRKGRVGLYYIGTWPTERGVKRAGYVTPNGLIEVTRETQNTQLSEHFRLKDFLTHDQANVWPKYVVVETKLIDKMELVLAELERRGIDPRGVRVLSGFRTPQYNAGGGDVSGRASLSRHMYGDAADIFIDADGDGNMDDLNRDGLVDIRDASVISAAVDRVERAHPTLLGGVGVYPGNSAHGPFTHIDTRGYRARWTGTGDGG